MRAGEIAFYYQPKISLRTGRPVGVEALARWVHPERGVLPPRDWIVATETPWLERRFLRYALGATCAQIAEWRARGVVDLTVCVNVSPRSFADPGLPELVAGTLERHGLPAATLGIELTEAALEVGPAHATAADELTRLGVGLALDDFGIGHSAMDRLVRLPLGELKIDRRFVVHHPTRVREAAVVTAAIALAHSLDMVCTAEGVESPAALTALAREECDLAQGFAIARPMPAAELERWVVDREAASTDRFETQPRLRLASAGDRAAGRA